MKICQAIFISVILLVNNPSRCMASDDELKLLAEKTILSLFAAAKDFDSLKNVSYVDWKMLASQPRNSISVEDMHRLFSNIDIKAVKFSEVIYKRPNGEFLLRVTSPIRYDFEFRQAPSDSDALVIVSIHP